MNEYETNPQRQPASADADAPQSTAELPRVEREHSDSITPAPSAQPAPPAQPVPPQQMSAQPVSAQPAPAQQVAQRGHERAAPQHAAAPFPPHPWPGQHPQPGGQQYPGAQRPAGWPGYPGHGPAAQHGAPPQPPYAGGGGGQPPVWAQQPGSGAPRPDSGRVVKLVAAAAVAFGLMIGSGIAGGAAALALHDDAAVSRADTRAASAPVINRSSLAEIASKVQHSVVSIATGSGEGSGVVLTADGYILTNNHVVESGRGGTVNVVFADGKNATARLVGTDPKTDLAVVQARGVSGLVPAKFGDSSAMQVGDTVLALGSPLGLQGSVTAGIISAENRTIQAGGQQETPFSPGTPGTSMSGLLQTDAPINPGNSGGALVNTNGEVIGINTAIATSGQGTGNIGVGFAIPSNKAKAVADALRKGEKVSHPYIGVSVSRAPNGGAVVGAVTPNGPADKAGLQKGDIITRFGDKPVHESDDLVSAVQSGKVGDRVSVTYTRDGAQRTATVTLAEAS